MTEDEQRHIQAGLRSSDALRLRRGPILRAPSRGEQAPAIARQPGCDDQSVRKLIHGCNATGLSVLQEGSSHPHRLHTRFSEDGLVRVKDEARIAVQATQTWLRGVPRHPVSAITTPFLEW